MRLSNCHVLWITAALVLALFCSMPGKEMLVLVPATEGGPKPAVLYVDSAGKSPRRGEGIPW